MLEFTMFDVFFIHLLDAKSFDIMLSDGKISMIILMHQPMNVSLPLLSQVI